MNYKISPRVGINEVAFGMTPEQVKSFMPGGEFVEVRNVSKEYPTYEIIDNDNSLFFYFSKKGLLNAFEFSSGLNAELDQVNLAVRYYPELQQAISKITDDFQKTKEGFISKKLGMSVWMQYPEDNEVTSILFGNQKYIKTLIDLQN